MPLYAPWPVRAAPQTEGFELYPGLRDVNAGAGSPGIPLLNLGWLAWAAMDGVVSYDEVGRQTFLYWVAGNHTASPGFYRTDAAGNRLPDPIIEPLPSEVTRWLTAFHALPIVIVDLDVAQGTTPGWPQELSYVGDLWNYLVRVRRIQDSGTAGAWTPPGGGSAFPPEPAIPSGASDALSINFWLQDQANQRWGLLTSRWPGTLGSMPMSPFPAVALSSQEISSQMFGAVQVPVGGSQVVSASQDASGNVTLLTTRVTGYDPATGVTNQGSTALEPPGATGALPFTQLVTPAQSTPNTPAVVQSGAGPVAPAAGSAVPGANPTVATNLTSLTFDWQKWGALAGIGAALAVLVLAAHTMGGRK